MGRTGSADRGAHSTTRPLEATRRRSSITSTTWRTVGSARTSSQAVVSTKPASLTTATRSCWSSTRGLSQFRPTKLGLSPLGVNDLSHRYVWQPDAVDQLMADERTHLDANGNVATAELLWAFTDHQGTVHDLAKLNTSTGVTAVVDHIIRDSFGKVISESDPSQGSLIGWTGPCF